MPDAERQLLSPAGCVKAVQGAKYDMIPSSTAMRLVVQAPQEKETMERQVGQAGQRLREALGEGWSTLEVLVMEPSAVAAELEAEQGTPAEVAAMPAKPASATPGAQHGAGTHCRQGCLSAG